MIIKPIFPTFEESEYCNSACEYSLMESRCDCKECKGLHHGRAAYFDRTKSGVPFGENVTLVRCGGFRAYVRSSDVNSEEFRQFLDIAKPDTLSEIYMSKRKGKPALYGRTEFPLKELGIWSVK